MTFSTTLIIIALLVIVFLTLTLVLVNWLKSMQASLDETKKTISDTLLVTSANVTESLTQTTREINDRLVVATHLVGELKRDAGAFAELGHSMKDLQDFLKSPKLRGNIGERVMADLLGQIFPRSSYALQYQFRSGEKVDAIIKTDAGILPIDSKFPMENYQKMVSSDTQVDIEQATHQFAKDIKKHITDISRKYILPSEKTLDFALMYVPSEPVYYELAKNSDLMEYARSVRVYPVSPNTMYATLQTILLSFEGKKIESKAKEVFVLLRSLSIDYEKTNTHLITLGNHIRSAFNKYNEVQGSMGQIGQKLDSTKLLDT